jgi:hypothetical protein
MLTDQRLLVCIHLNCPGAVSGQAARKAAHNAIVRSRSDGITQKCYASDATAGNKAATWGLHAKFCIETQAPTSATASGAICHLGLQNFSSGKIVRHLTFDSSQFTSSQMTKSFRLSSNVCSSLQTFAPASVVEVCKLLHGAHLNSPPLDILPSSLLPVSINVFAPVITHMASLSYAEDRLPAAFKTAQVMPLLKNPTQDKELPKNHRRMSSLSNISKVF